MCIFHSFPITRIFIAASSSFVISHTHNKMSPVNERTNLVITGLTLMVVIYCIIRIAEYVSDKHHRKVMNRLELKHQENLSNISRFYTSTTTSTQPLVTPEPEEAETMKGVNSFNSHIPLYTMLKTSGQHVDDCRAEDIFKLAHVNPQQFIRLITDLSFIEASYFQAAFNLCCNLDMVTAVKILLDKGVDPNMPTDVHKQFPIHLAIINGATRTVELLIKHGARVNVRDSFGSIPLHIAARLAKKNIVRILYAYYEPSFDQGNICSRTVLHEAVGCNFVSHDLDDQHKDMIQELRRPIIEFLLHQTNPPVDVHSMDACGKTPLDYTLQFGFTKLSVILTEAMRNKTPNERRKTL